MSFLCRRALDSHPTNRKSLLYDTYSSSLRAFHFFLLASFSVLTRLSPLPVFVPPIRDIPMPLVSSGVEHGNLRELALARMKDMGTEVRLALH